MEVMYWQLFVIGSVVGTYLIESRKAALWVTIGWTAWTFVMIFSAPLLLVQLASAWGSFLVVDNFKKSSADLAQAREKLAGFERATSGFSGEVRELAHTAENQGNVFQLQDVDHYFYLMKSISEAKASLLVLSGWLSSSVVDDAFCRALRDALSRGVNIYLGYGWEDSKGHHKVSARNLEAMRTLRSIANDAIHMQGILKVGAFNNHQKILIRDSAEVVCGSHNWLSNRTFKNREKSFVVSDPLVAEQAFAECRPLIEGNLEI